MNRLNWSIEYTRLISDLPVSTEVVGEAVLESQHRDMCGSDYILVVGTVMVCFWCVPVLVASAVLCCEFISVKKEASCNT